MAVAATPVRARAGARLRPATVPRPLAALLAACALLSVGWALAMAPLQGPDEHNHLGYVQQLAETGGGPSFGASDGRSWSSEQIEWQSWQNLLSLIGIADARPGWNPAEEARFQAYEDALPPGARSDGTGPNPVAQNPPLYYAYEAIPYWAFRWADLPTRVLAMRLANVPLYLLIVTFAWLAAGELFRRRRLAQTVAAGSVGLLPQLAFMSGVVNPDFLLATIWAAFAYAALVAVRVGPRPRVLAALGVLAAASALTHGRGLAIVGPLAIVLAVIAWRARPLGRRTLLWSGGTLVAFGAGLLAAFAYSGAHGGGSSLGGEVGSAAGAGSPKGFVSYLWQFYLPGLRTMSPQGPDYGYRQVYVEGLGGTFGSLEIQFPLWVYDALQLSAALGLLLVFALVVRRWEVIRRNAAQLVAVASLPLSMLAVLHLSAYRDLQGPPFDPLLTGRYLLPLVVPMGLAIAFACDQLPRRWGALLGTLVLTTFAVLSLCGLGLTVSRFYA